MAVVFVRQRPASGALGELEKQSGGRICLHGFMLLILWISQATDFVEAFRLQVELFA